MTLALTRTAYAEDLSTSSWEDDSVYGGSNPDRNEGAVYLTAYKVDALLVETAVTVTAFDPETATTFTTANPDTTGDGHYKYYFIFADNWLVGTTYNQYDVVWSTDEEGFYEYTNATPSAGNLVTDVNYWTALEDPTTKIADVGTAEESGNLSYLVVQKVLDIYGSVCRLKSGIQFAKQQCPNDDCGCDTRLGKYYTKIRNLYTSLAMYETTGRYTDGEKAARLLEKYCDDCGCLDE